MINNDMPLPPLGLEERRKIWYRSRQDGDFLTGAENLEWRAVWWETQAPLEAPVG